MAKLSSDSSARLLAEISSLYALAPQEEFPNRVLSLVQRLIGCDAASYNEVELSTGHFRALIDPKDTVDETIAPAFARFVHEHPVITHVATTGDTQALAISDFLRPVEFHRLGLYGEFFHPLGFTDQLSMTLPAARGARILAIALNRSASFSELDRVLLSSLQPHLIVAHENALKYSLALTSRATDGQFAATATVAISRLTDRQREILRLISTGSTNFQVSAELGVSVGTVKKHVEHILERLDVETRLGAARIYLSAGSSDLDEHWWTVDGDAEHELL